MLPLLLAARECSTVFVVSKLPPPAAVPNPPFLCQNFLCLTCNTLLVHHQLSSYRQLGENYFLGGRHRYYFSLNKNSSKKTPNFIILWFKAFPQVTDTALRLRVGVRVNWWTAKRKHHIQHYECKDNVHSQGERAAPPGGWIFVIGRKF